MDTRRDFLQTAAGALGSPVFVGCNLMTAAIARAQTRRREVMVGGRRVRTVDVHAHCAVPEALSLLGQKLGGPSLRPDLEPGLGDADKSAILGGTASRLLGIKS